MDWKQYECLLSLCAWTTTPIDWKQYECLLPLCAWATTPMNWKQYECLLSFCASATTPMKRDYQRKVWTYLFKDSSQGNQFWRELESKFALRCWHNTLARDLQCWIPNEYPILSQNRFKKPPLQEINWKIKRFSSWRTFCK